MSLILEPEHWNLTDLLELAGTQDQGLRQILTAISSGQVPFPSPMAQEAAVELLRVAIDLFESMGKGASAPQVAATVNVQYQTMIAVSALIPPKLVQEQAAKNRARKASGEPLEAGAPRD